MNNKPNFDDKRKYIRHLTINLIAYTQYDKKQREQQIGLAKSYDLSIGGIGVLLNNQFPIETRVKLEIAINEIIIVVYGTIVYSLGNPVKNEITTLYTHGIEFDTLTEEQKQILENYLKDKTIDK